jgi:hypothetical protein
MTEAPPFPGYEEMRRLHGEEMAARGLRSAVEFCSSVVESLDELLLRVRSIASWMEAHEAFSLWLVFKELRGAWRGDISARARTLQALYLSQLPQKFLIDTKHRGRELLTARFSEGVRIGTDYGNRPWTEGQWRNILRQAAGLVGKRYGCTELELWVWWAYPVFRRYGWNTRQVLGVASERGMDFEKEKAGIDQLMVFQKYWIRRGLRFAGGKQRQDSAPPLWEFVKQVVLPETGKMWGPVGGLLLSSGKKTSTRNE